MKMEIMIQEVKQELQVQGIVLSNEDLIVLRKFQERVLKKLEWIEFDSQKLLEIIQVFLYSGYLYPDNYMDLLKQSIVDYYRIRKQLDPLTSDEEILMAMKEFVQKQYLFGEYCVEKIIQELNGKSRKERWEEAW